jgi:general secretion pathway protein M
MKQMSPQMSRFAAVGLLVVLILTLVFYGIMPLVQTYKSNADEVAILEKRLVTLRSMLANKSLVDNALERLDSMNTTGDVFLKGNKVAIASANLREFVSDVVKESGGVLVSTQDYETESLDIANAVGLRLQFNGEINNLSDLLYKLESARPLVFIDKMTITSSAAKNRRGSRSRRLSARSSRKSLTVRLDIFGYMVTG